jgi:hypothetical protein
MSTSPFTSANDTDPPSGDTSPSIPNPDPTKLYVVSPFGSAPGAPGNTLMNTSTDRPNQRTDTDTSTSDCDFEHIMSDDGRHPVGIVCTTHGWSGHISDGE